MTNRIAASLAMPDTERCLATLHQLAPEVGMAEIRLDLMDSFDLPRLIAEAPCPLIITCRPPREGGRFTGSEDDRLAILTQAMDLGAAYVDVEWDSLAALSPRRCTGTKLIASRHWFDHVPASLSSVYAALRTQADVVKLVGAARRVADTLPIFDLLRRAMTPVIGLAMGQAGRLTRLLAPCFPPCLLTYGAPAPEAVTAPGQLTVSQMRDLYQLQAVGPHTAIHLHLCAAAASADAVIDKNASVIPGERLYVPVVVSLEEAAEIASGLRAYLAHVTLTADSSLAAALPEMGQRIRSAW
jgi:3-dehydroquinate dehydratase/shikimate dehydrogenase